MAKQGQTNQGLEGLTAAAKAAANTKAAAKGLPPVHLWNPPFCGDLDMRIASDGTWFYMGTPIGRPALVRLFSTILKREDGKHFLVTPVEKVGIRVDDAPFLAVDMVRENDARGRVLRFRTNVDDWVACDSADRRPALGASVPADRAGRRQEARAGPARGAPGPGGRPAAAARAAAPAPRPSQRSRRPDFLSRRQDRRGRRLAARGRVARGGGR